MNVHLIKAISLSVVFCFLLVSDSPGQVPFSSIVKITARDGGVGTGFIVATDGKTAEVWTNAHVAGRVTDTVRIAFGEGGQVSEGRVVASKLDRSTGSDWAKLLVKIPDGAVVSSLVVGSSDNSDEPFCSGGWPLGRKLHSVLLHPTNDVTSIGTAFSPRPEGGESGSPVIKNGKVVGVVTWTFLTRRPFGVYQPIENWSGERKPVKSAWFKFQVVPIGKYYAASTK